MKVLLFFGERDEIADVPDQPSLTFHRLRTFASNFRAWLLVLGSFVRRRMTQHETALHCMI